MIPIRNRSFGVIDDQNEEIFVQLDELDELDTIPYACIGFNYNLTQTQKAFYLEQWLMCLTVNQVIPGQVSEFFKNFILLNHLIRREL